jgi:DNA-directed RNA polymerase specialized sigma24 family protein
MVSDAHMVCPSGAPCAKERLLTSAASIKRPGNFQAKTKRLELRDLDRALARLPEEQRTVIFLIGLEGMDYATAAKVVGVPVGTVLSRRSRGREELRRLMGIKPNSHAEAKMARAA